MNRKHNPLVSLAALVLLGAILALAFSGCAKEANAAQRHRFTYEFGGWLPGANEIYTITDTKTGVQYLVVEGNGTSVTVLQPGEG